MAQSTIQVTHLFSLRREGYFDYELLQGCSQQMVSKLENGFSATKGHKRDQTEPVGTDDEFNTVCARTLGHLDFRVNTRDLLGRGSNYINVHFQLLTRTRRGPLSQDYYARNKF